MKCKISNMLVLLILEGVRRAVFSVSSCKANWLLACFYKTYMNAVQM